MDALAPEAVNLDYMHRRKPGSGCVRSASYNRLLNSTAFLTRECFALEQKGAFAAPRGGGRSEESAGLGGGWPTLNREAAGGLCPDHIATEAGRAGLEVHQVERRGG